MISAIFFTTTVLTSIGYGNLIPISTGGKIFCVGYAIFGFVHLCGIEDSRNFQNSANSCDNCGFSKICGRYANYGSNGRPKNWQTATCSSIFTWLYDNFCMCVYYFRADVVIFRLFLFLFSFIGKIQKF